jgi:hypothetical protein
MSIVIDVMMRGDEFNGGAYGKRVLVRTRTIIVMTMIMMMMMMMIW